MGIQRLVFDRLVDGVSRQPAIQRAPSYCEDLVNAEPNLVSGLRKRQGFRRRYFDTLGTFAVGTTQEALSLGTKVSSTLSMIFSVSYEDVSGTDKYVINAIKYDPNNDTCTLSTQLAFTDQTYFVEGTAVTDIEDLRISSTLKTLKDSSSDTGSLYIFVTSTLKRVLISTDITVATMPRVIEVTSAGVMSDVSATFWQVAMNEAGSPIPSFVNDRITHVGTWQNRLVVASSNSVILSRANNLKSFWVTDPATPDPADPIDFSLSDSVGGVYYSAPIRNGLALFSSDGQYLLTAGDNAITIGNIRVERISNYTSLTTTPVSTPSGIVFTTYGPRRNEGTVEEPSVVMTSSRVYLMSLDATVTELTAVIPGYIEGGIEYITAYENGVFLARGDTVYVMELLKNDQGISQAAWSRWTLGGITSGTSSDEVTYIKGMFTDSGNIFVLHTSPYNAPNLVLSSMALEPSLEINEWTKLEFATDQGVPIILDNMMHKNIVDGKITFAVGEEYRGGDGNPRIALVIANFVAIRTDTGEQVTMSAHAESWSIAVSNDDGSPIEGGTIPIILGNPVHFSYVFSKQYPRDRNGRALNKERMIYRNMTLSLENSVALDVRIAVSQRTDVVHEIRSIKKGIDFVEYADGLFCVPPTELDMDETVFLYGDAKETVLSLESSEPYPVTISSVTIEALVYSRFS